MKWNGRQVATIINVAGWIVLHDETGQTGHNTQRHGHTHADERIISIFFSIYINVIYFTFYFPFFPNLSLAVCYIFIVLYALFVPQPFDNNNVWRVWRDSLIISTHTHTLLRMDFVSCWMDETDYTNILVAPVCLSILLNLVFLCNIVRVLLLKLKSPAGSQSANAPSRNILQAFRWVRSASIEIKLKWNFVFGCTNMNSEHCFVRSCWRFFFF